MLKIGKLAQQAIAAATYLAERYNAEGTRVSAAEIADARELPRPVVAKLLASLSLNHLTTGTTGPTGGYRLARPPEKITLHDIVAVFERMDIRPMCPFGPNYCGNGTPCPLHDAISVASDQVDDFLKSQHLGPFHRQGGKTAASRVMKKPAAKKKHASKKR
ncbi:MAG: Rrf2 family transcriptional regulator [Verrucomicrobiaceae bacterium]|nr:Rrf2 family transcriptional regulator [Verrucomicrobiaceae bacterium]